MLRRIKNAADELQIVVEDESPGYALTVHGEVRASCCFLKLIVGLANGKYLSIGVWHPIVNARDSVPASKSKFCHLRPRVSLTRRPRQPQTRTMRW